MKKGEQSRGREPTAQPASAPRILYLHGFASSPESTKARAFAARMSERSIDTTRLDLRVPSFAHLRFSEMMRVVCEAIGSERDRVVVVGSSLGGLTAARVAERDPRVTGLVLLAPAFQLAQRWKARIGEDAFRAWEESGWLEVDDHASVTKARVDFGFIEELARMDVGFPDVRVPTLVIHGTRDDVVDPELSRAFARGKSFVRLVEVDDGHELGASIPAFLRHAEEFLSPWFG
jgi:pimeloyl-ACP methyl ester carboxylesterase